MNRESARVFQDDSLKLETLSFNKIPHQSKLFLDFQADSPNVAKFYPEKQTALPDFAEKVLANYKVDRNELCDSLAEINQSFGAGAKTLENIELLREKDCVAIVTGQQAGLFSGALYTVYKALSAVRLCADLKKQNVKVVPVFWIAEEDHDFDEVKKTYFLDREGKLAEIENTPENHSENRAVGSIVLDETIETARKTILSGLVQTEFIAEVEKILSESYQTGETFSDAFGRFLARIFSSYGLIFLSPLNQKLKNLCSPIFAEAIESSDAIIENLLARNIELKKENYAPQVLVEENSYPFFYLNEKSERFALRRDLPSGRIKIQNSKTDFDKAQLKEIAERAPQNLSPNALLRPVVQDYLLPTLVYFGGAAEIAYFAQNAVIYKTLNRPATPIKHRSSFTIIESKHGRTLKKYELELADLFDGKEKILSGVVEKFLNNETARAFAEAEENINAQLNRLDRHLLDAEPTLSENLANRRRKILWHIGALRKKYHRAEILKNEIVRRRIETLFDAVLPHNALQERALNVLTFLNLYGENFIDWVYNAIEAEEKGHQILYL
ncbi:MAG TPA: bacillithiol biosynthesis cysteine-adding enzyme BshC [Pyrinomonadaceae bacterium]|jgi:bacillithiol biosynthesis cysteine-adding enzyme BshC